MEPPGDKLPQDSLPHTIHVVDDQVQGLIPALPILFIVAAAALGVPPMVEALAPDSSCAGGSVADVVDGLDREDDFEGGGEERQEPTAEPSAASPTPTG